jgi:hypothetical protein
MMQERVRSITAIRAHGTQRIPAAPRGVGVQPAQGGAVVTWHLPSNYDDVTGYRIYVGTEKNLSLQIRDRGTRQIFVPLAAGATPKQNNIFISVVNGFREGPRLQVQGRALDNGTMTEQVVPLPAFDFVEQFSGGLDKTQSGQPSGKRVP